MDVARAWARVRAMSFVETTQDGQVSTLTINRPDKLNALSQEVLGDLSAAVEELSRRDDVRAAVITGTGKAFVAGADIAAMRDMDDYLDDLGIFLQRVRDRQPGKPLVLFGHSMGGLIVGLYAATRDKRAAQAASRTGVEEF